MYNFVRKSSFRKVAALKKLANLKVYTNVDSSTATLQKELGEYFHNGYTRDRFPDLAETEEELINLISQGKTRALSLSELESLDNSDVSNYVGAEAVENPMEEIERMSSEYGRDINRIFNGIEKGDKFPTPIVIEKEGELYLMAGNTRLCVFAVKGMTLPVKVIKHP